MDTLRRLRIPRPKEDWGFTVTLKTVYAGHLLFGHGSGKSKRDAKQAALQDLLTNLSYQADVHLERYGVLDDY